MKITQGPPEFKPVVITLESLHECNDVLDFMAAALEHGTHKREIALEIYNKLHRVLFA